jgi:ABC-2 type transport system ATP-binding protein
MQPEKNNNEIAIEASDITKRFRPNILTAISGEKSEQEVIAVNQVNLKVNRGEIFGLVGPNGAGKTTLIKMLTTLLLPTSGTANIAGYDVIHSAYHVRKLVGLVTSNERSFFWRLTGRQNLDFFASLYHIPRKISKERIAALFELLGLIKVADKRFDSYSTGMKQRLSIARGLLSKPNIIFMDEPTKGVDPIGTNEIIEIIKNQIVREWNSTLLITSHNLREIERLCNRIAIMNNGRIIAVGTLDELHAKTKCVDTYRMTVHDILKERLERIIKKAEALDPIRLMNSDSAIELEVNFKQGSNGFSRILKSIIIEGGTISKCTQVSNSFDDIFQTLVQNHVNQIENKEGY